METQPTHLIFNHQIITLQALYLHVISILVSMFLILCLELSVIETSFNTNLQGKTC